MMPVTQASDLRNTLMANTTYRINATLELDSNAVVRGQVGTVISCVNVDVCLRTKGTGTTTVTTLQILYSSAPSSRTFVMAANNSKIEMSNISLAPSSASFTLLGGVGDMQVTMRDITLRSCALIAGNDTTGQSISVDLTRVNVTSANNVILLNGGTAQTNSNFKIVDSEIGGASSASVLIRLGSPDANVTNYRDFSVEGTTFRSGTVDFRIYNTARFTDTFHISSWTTGMFRDLYVLRSQFRGNTLPAWTVNRAMSMKFDTIDIDASRSLLVTNATLDDLKVYNVNVGGPLSNYMIEFVGNASLKGAHSAIQNVTMRSCQLAKLNGSGLEMRNITFRDVSQSSSLSSVMFGNVSNLDVSDWTVDNATCGTLIELSGKLVQSTSIDGLTLTNSSLNRVIAVTNQSDGALTIERISANASKIRKLFSVETNCSLRLIVDQIDVFNCSFIDIIMHVRTDEPAVVSNVLWRSVNLSSHGIVVDNNLADEFTLFNLTGVDLLQTAFSTNFVFIAPSPRMFKVNVSKLWFENSTCAAAALGVSAVNQAPVRGAAIVDDFFARNVRVISSSGAVVRLQYSSLNANLTRFNISDSDMPLSVNSINSLQLIGARLARVLGGVYVLNTPTVIVRDIEYTDSTSPCSGSASPLVFSGSTNVTLQSVWLARLRCAGAGTVAVTTKTLLMSNVTMIDNALPVINCSNGFDNVTIDSCRFEGNVNATAGSVLAMASTGIVNIVNSVFLDNVGADVGVLSLSSYADLRVTRSQFFNNTAQRIGGISVASSNVVVDQCVFRDNVALNGSAGALYMNNCKVSNVSNSDFVGNRATITYDTNNIASALQIYQGKAALVNVTVRENTLATPLYHESYGALYVHFLTEMIISDVCVCGNWHGVGNEPLARTNFGCYGSLVPSNAMWSIRTVLANQSNCNVFANATCPLQPCALRMADSFQMPSRTTAQLTTSTSSTRRTTTLPPMSSVNATNVTSMAMDSNALMMTAPDSNIGMIVGIVLGSLACIGLLAVIVLLIKRKRRTGNGTASNSSSNSSNYGSVRDAVQQREFVSARDEYGSLTQYQKGFDIVAAGDEPHYNSTFRMLD